MQQTTAEGVRPAAGESSRASFVVIHSAPEQFKEALRDMWQTRTPKEAAELLAKPDVTVTNQSDKEQQIAKLADIDAKAKQAFRKVGAARV